MDKIKVLHMSKNLRINGISNVILNYCLNLDKNKFDITIMAGPPICDDYKKKCEDAGVNIIELPPKRGKNPLYYYKKINEELKQKKFDIAHIHGNSATITIESFLAKKNGIAKVIAHCHSTNCSYKIVHKVLRPILNHYVDEGLACSSIAGKWLFGKRKFNILQNSFDTKKYIFNRNNRDKTREELGLQDKNIIGSVAIFTDTKNHQFMLDVFNYIGNIDENAVLLFIGAGPNFENIKNQVSKHKYSDRIILYGETTDVGRFYDAMDYFFMPSKFEGLGIVLVEAQIKGLKCVISDVIPEQAILNIENVTRLSLEDNPENWARYFNNKNSVEKRTSYYKDNKDLIAKYDIYDNVKELEGIYEKLIRGDVNK